MPLLLLIRHGENEFVKTGKLPGRLPGIHLNEKGQKQAQALSDALKDVPIKAVYSSPLERAMETAGPMLLAIGTPAQKARFLKRIAAIEDCWCQGFTEPEAGSDLGAIATAAVRDGDSWVINGRKIWTSQAHAANWC